MHPASAPRASSGFRTLLKLGPLLLAPMGLILAVVPSVHAGGVEPEPFVWTRVITSPGANPSGAANAVALDPAGNVLAVGQLRADGITRFTVVKLDADGSQIWLRTVPGDFGNATAVTTGADGAVFVAGSRRIGGVTQSVVAKWDAAGTPSWTTTFSPDAATASIATSLVLDGAGDVLAGGSISTSESAGDWAVAKVNGATGDLAWVRRGHGIDGVGVNAVASVAVDGGDHVAAAGYGTAANGSLEFLILRLNGATGVPFWSLFDGNPGAHDQARSVSVAHDGSIVVGGYFAPGGQRQVTVAKYHRDTGNRLWIDQSLGTANSGVGASAVQVNSRGNAVAVGLSQPAPTELHLTAAELRDSTGVPIWSTDVPPPVADGFSFANDGALDSQDRLVTGGGSGGNNPVFEDFTVWQFHSTGPLARVRVLASPVDGQGEVLGVATGPNGFAAAGGYYQTEGSNDVQFTVAYLDPAVSTTSGTTRFAVTAPANTAAGDAFNITVTARDAANQPVPGYLGTVRFTSADSQAVLPENYTFTPADAGSHTFTVTLRSSGAQRVTVADTAVPVVLGNANVTVTAGLAARLVVEQQPTTVIVNHVISPSVTVRVTDQYRNTVSSAKPMITLSLRSNPTAAVLGGTISLAAVNGVATFSTLTVSKVGNGYTLTPSAPSLMGPFTESAPFDVMPEPDSVAPVITRIEVEPRTVIGSGGPVAIRVLASDNVAPPVVTGTVTRGEVTTALNFTRVVGRGYLATFKAPRNLTADWERYTLVVVATDGAGNSATGDGGTISVGPRPVSERLLKNHQEAEERNHYRLERLLRAQYRSASARIRTALERYLREALASLRLHWRMEVRLSTILPRDPFPPFVPPS